MKRNVEKYDYQVLNDAKIFLWKLICQKNFIIQGVL